MSRMTRSDLKCFFFGNMTKLAIAKKMTALRAWYFPLSPHLTQKEQNEEARDFEKSINSKSAAIFF